MFVWQLVTGVVWLLSSFFVELGYWPVLRG